MSLQTIIGTVIAIVVVGAGAWYFTSRPATSPQVVEQQSTGNAESGSATFASFLAQGGSRSCDVTVENESAPASGVVFVNGDQIRADITARPTTFGGVEVRAHMIQTGGYVYSWSDLIPRGVKIVVSQGISAAAQQGFDANAQVSYTCSPWVPDPSKFVVPATVTFMELEAQPQ